MEGGGTRRGREPKALKQSGEEGIERPPAASFHWKEEALVSQVLLLACCSTFPLLLCPFYFITSSLPPFRPFSPRSGAAVLSSLFLRPDSGASALTLPSQRGIPSFFFLFVLRPRDKCSTLFFSSLRCRSKWVELSPPSPLIYSPNLFAIQPGAEKGGRRELELPPPPPSMGESGSTASLRTGTNCLMRASATVVGPYTTYTTEEGFCFLSPFLIHSSSSSSAAVLPPPPWSSPLGPCKETEAGNN